MYKLAALCAIILGGLSVGCADDTVETTTTDEYETEVSVPATVTEETTTEVEVHDDQLEDE